MAPSMAQLASLQACVYIYICRILCRRQYIYMSIYIYMLSVAILSPGMPMCNQFTIESDSSMFFRLVLIVSLIISCHTLHISRKTSHISEKMASGHSHTASLDAFVCSRPRLPKWVRQDLTLMSVPCVVPTRETSSAAGNLAGRSKAGMEEHVLESQDTIRQGHQINHENTNE